jgi:hypothetical protein
MSSQVGLAQYRDWLNEMSAANFEIMVNIGWVTGTPYIALAG